MQELNSLNHCVFNIAPIHPLPNQQAEFGSGIPATWIKGRTVRSGLYQ